MICIGVLASSMGAGISTFLILLDDQFRPKTYASVSPLPGWPHMGTKEIRKRILNSRADIPVYNQRDQELGVQRYIRGRDLPKIVSIDTLPLLRQQKLYMQTFTVIGENDRVVQPKSMRRYHRLLGGTEENLLELPEGHSIPLPSYEERMKRFFIKALEIKN